MTAGHTQPTTSPRSRTRSFKSVVRFLVGSSKRSDANDFFDCTRLSPRASSQPKRIEEGRSPAAARATVASGWRSGVFEPGNTDTDSLVDFKVRLGLCRLSRGGGLTRVWSGRCSTTSKTSSFRPSSLHPLPPVDRPHPNLRLQSTTAGHPLPPPHRSHPITTRHSRSAPSTRAYPALIPTSLPTRHRQIIRHQTSLSRC